MLITSNIITKKTETENKIAVATGIIRSTAEIVLGKSVRPQRKVETNIIKYIVSFISKLLWLTGTRLSERIRIFL